MSAIALLCEIIAQGAKACTRSFCTRAGYDALVHCGYARETGVVQSCACHECDDPHDAEIVWENDHYGFFCPENGFVPVERSKITGVQPNLPNLVAGLAAALDCKRRKTTPVHGMTWRIGAVETPTGDLMLYFHPLLRSAGDVRDLETALGREIRSPFRLIVTADGALSVLVGKTARLDEVAELDIVSGRMLATADVRAIVEAPRAISDGRPNQFGARLQTLIQSRIQAGNALPGRNEEAQAILIAYRDQFPNAQPPSLPTIKRYLTEERRGS